MSYLFAMVVAPDATVLVIWKLTQDNRLHEYSSEAFLNVEVYDYHENNMKKNRAWQGKWRGFFFGTDVRVATVVVVVYALWVTYIDPVPLGTLSLAGRQALVLDVSGLQIPNTQGDFNDISVGDVRSPNDVSRISTSERDRDCLRLVTYHWFNIPTSVLIPNTPFLDFYDGATDQSIPILRPTAILDSGTVVWTDTRDGKNYKIMKYEGGKTSEVISIPLFDLPTFADKYEKGQVSITEQTISSTGDIYRAPFVLYPDNSIGFLDAMATRGNGQHLTEAEVRVRKVDVGTGLERDLL